MAAEAGSPALDLITTIRLLPVIVIEKASHAEALGRTLIHAGVPLAEVTLRTPAALEATRELAQLPEMMVGVGSVTRPAQVTEALTAGAKFLISPGFSHEVIREARQAGALIIPGIATASELMRAIDAGISTVKFFPAATAGGPAAIGALAVPFDRVRFIPTGGITEGNFLDYLGLRSVIAVGGSWITPPTAISGEHLAGVADRAAGARRAIKEAGL